MQGRSWAFIIVTFVVLVIPNVASSQGNIYQEAIPHIKSCISLLKEREADPTPTSSTKPDLREVCPTLAYFLTYEPISEIDPPLENHSDRAYLESVVKLLESVYNSAAASQKINFPNKPEQYAPASDPQQKPFVMAMTQWLFSHFHNWLASLSGSIQPGARHTIYIVAFNFVIVILSATVLLYSIAQIRSSGIYRKHFQIRWQKTSEPAKPVSLEDITRLKMPLQIPALVTLVKQTLQTQGIVILDPKTGNAEFVAHISQKLPNIARDLSRLMRLHDRIQYGNKKPAADEVNQAIELTRQILGSTRET